MALNKLPNFRNRVPTLLSICT